MSAIGITKTVTELVVATGVGSIVASTIKQATPENAKFLKKVSIGVGAFVLSSWIGSQAAEYATGKIDEVVDSVNTVKGAIDELKSA